MKTLRYFNTVLKRGTSKAPHCIIIATSDGNSVAVLFPNATLRATDEDTVLSTTDWRRLCDMADRFQETWALLRPLQKAGGWQANPLPEAFYQRPYQVELTAKPTAERNYPEVVASATGESYHAAFCQAEVQLGMTLDAAPSAQATHYATYSRWEDGQWVEVKQMDLPSRDFLFKNYSVKLS